MRSDGKTWSSDIPRDACGFICKLILLDMQNTGMSRTNGKQVYMRQDR